MKITIEMQDGTSYDCSFQEERFDRLPSALRIAAEHIERKAEQKITAHLREIVKDEFTSCAETGKVTTRNESKRKRKDEYAEGTV